MHVTDLGRIPFRQAEALQIDAHARVLAGGEDELFLLEHTSVVTFGRHGGEEFLRVPPEALAALGVETAKTTRGGSVTCHYPGQLVAYPVFRIDRRKGGVARFFHDVEEVAIRSLADFGVIGARVTDRPGVWVGERKIASIGIAVRRWVTYHGLSLNVAADTRLFDLISLCGLPDARATSLEFETGRAVPMDAVKESVRAHFAECFAPSALAQGEAASR